MCVGMWGINSFENNHIRQPKSLIKNKTKHFTVTSYLHRTVTLWENTFTDNEKDPQEQTLVSHLVCHSTDRYAINTP